jgi:hypothetical protein
MKNFSAFFLAGSLLLGTACGNHTSPAPPAQKEDSTGTSFLPVADYLRAEISYVDSTPLAIRKYTTRDNQKDSSFIQQEEFNRLSKEFLTPELAADSFFQNFSENSFLDKTTGYLSFTYSTRNKALPLQRVDVLAAPGVDMDKVKSIYLEKVFPAGDTIVVKKMFWQTGRSFLILTSLRLPGKAPLDSQLKVVWDTDNSE